MYLLKVFNGTQHFLNLCTVLFLNMVIIWYKKIRLTKKCNFPTNSKNSKFQKKTALRGFFWNWSLHPCYPFYGFHLRWGSDIQFLVDNVEASHLYGLQVNRRAFRKPVMLGSWPARVRLLAASALFFFRKVKSSAAMEAIRGSGHICWRYWRLGTLESSQT